MGAGAEPPALMQLNCGRRPHNEKAAQGAAFVIQTLDSHFRGNDNILKIVPSSIAEVDSTFHSKQKGGRSRLCEIENRNQAVC
jgi:hypothetical protein